ncbi:MAG TPA: hypothetical protein VKK31_05075 [Thermoanaerobaculia bacterium]|nr:hypothetical protein [Thermoanaerobaculia bacterium]
MAKSAASPYHRQDSGKGCGAAVAMMMLSDPQAGVPVGELTQSELFNMANQKFSAKGWEMHPRGLEHSLNSHKEIFSLHENAGFLEGMGVIAATLDGSGIGAAVLINGGEHWVIVNEIIVKFINGRDQVVGVKIHNPWASDGVPPSSHQDGDTCSNSGNPNKDVSITDWLEAFRDCQCVNELLTQQFPVVAAKTSGKAFDLKIFEPSPVKPSLFHGIENYIQKNFLSLVDSVHLGGRLPGSADYSPPRLVKPLGQGRKPYYIVTLSHSDKITGVASIDAETALVRSIQRLGSKARIEGVLGTIRLREGNRDSVRDYLAETAQALEELLRAKLKSEDFETALISDSQVWKSCDQSRSEYLPFWIVVIRDSTVYVRLDGQFFLHLTSESLGV